MQNVILKLIYYDIMILLARYCDSFTYYYVRLLGSFFNVRFYQTNIII